MSITDATLPDSEHTINGHIQDGLCVWLPSVNIMPKIYPILGCGSELSVFTAVFVLFF